MDLSLYADGVSRGGVKAAVHGLKALAQSIVAVSQGCWSASCAFTLVDWGAGNLHLEAG